MFRHRMPNMWQWIIFFLLFFYGNLVLGAPIQVSSDQTQSDFVELTKDIGVATSFKMMQSPRNVGNGRNVFGLEVMRTEINGDSEHWSKATDGKAQNNFDALKLKYHRGLSGHGDLSAFVGYFNNSNLIFVGFDHKDVFLKRDPFFASLRPTLNFVYGINRVLIITPAVDMSLGYALGGFTPYVSGGFILPHALVYGKPNVHSTVEWIPKAAVGFEVKIGEWRLVAEYEVSKLNSISLSFRM